jgi:uncharacterized protein (TIGR02147 family)
MQNYTLEPANFMDYRDFLKSRFKSIQTKNKKFSLQACAQKAKISKSLLQFLFQKKRHLGLDKVPGLAKCLKLSNDEEYFIYLMLCKSTSRNATVQNHFEKIMNRVRNQYVKVDLNEPLNSVNDEKSLYLNTLHMALQTLIRLPQFREDPDWILQNLTLPGLAREQVIQALLELEKGGFIQRDSNGNLHSREESVWRPDPYDPTGFSVYTAGAESVARLMRFPHIYRPSVYMTMSLAMDEKHLLAAEKFMIEVHHKLFQLSKDSQRPTSVVYIGNFFLTLARLKASTTDS